MTSVLVIPIPWGAAPAGWGLFLLASPEQPPPKLFLPVTQLAPCFPVILLVTAPAYPEGTRRWERGRGRMRWPGEDDKEGHSQHQGGDNRAA